MSRRPRTPPLAEVVVVGEAGTGHGESLFSDHKATSKVHAGASRYSRSSLRYCGGALGVLFVLAGVLVTLGSWTVWKSCERSSFLRPVNSVIRLKSFLEGEVDLPLEHHSLFHQPFVLVLGSGGMLGRSLVARLRAAHYRVLQVKGRHHLDLRQAGALDQLNDVRINFAFFLASTGERDPVEDDFDYAEDYDKNQHDQLLMYSNVFEWLSRKRIPFLFTSTYQAANPTTPFALIKRMGERLVLDRAELPSSLHYKDGLLGKVIRLFDVYGWESLGGVRSLINYWSLECARGKDITTSHHSEEMMQLMYVEDAAEALVESMDNFDMLPIIGTLGNDHWTSLAAVAQALEEHKCQVNFVNAGEKREHNILQKLLFRGSVDSEDGEEEFAKHQLWRMKKVTEKMRNSFILKGWDRWNSMVPLKQGIANVVEKWKETIKEFEEGPASPYITVALATRNDDHYPMRIENVERFVKTTLYFAKRYLIPMQVVVVEYNPPGDRKRLSEVLRVSVGEAEDDDDSSTSKKKLEGAGVFEVLVVPELVHRELLERASERRRVHGDLHFPFLEYVGRNIAFRRSKAPFFWAASPENIPSERIFRFLSKRRMRDDAYYVALQTNSSCCPIPDDMENFEAQEDFLRSNGDHETRHHHHTARSHFRRFVCSGDLDRGDVDSPSAGYSQIFPRQLFSEVHGYNEWLTSSHMDTLMLWKAASTNTGADKVLLEGHTFMQHVPGGIPEMPSVSMGDKIMRSAREYCCRGVSSSADANPRWGLPEVDLSSTSYYLDLSIQEHLHATNDTLSSILK